MVTDHDDGTISESPIGLEKYFGGQRPDYQLYYNNIMRERRLKDRIELRLNDNFLTDGSEKNLAVCKVVQGMDDGGSVWRAPLLALKETDSWFDDQRSRSNSTPGYGHMDMGDFREVVDYLTTWKQGTVSHNYPTRPQETYSRQHVFFVYVIVFLFYLLACGALLTYHFGLLERESVSPWSKPYYAAVQKASFNLTYVIVQSCRLVTSS